ncbi:MAG: hypothetical protein AAFX50_21005, partial [Acidobacteriota bacterium]
TGDRFAGDYRARTQLVVDGDSAGEAVAPFAIEPTILMTAQLTADASAYTPGSTARLEAQVTYADGNAVVRDAVGLLAITGPDGSVAAESTEDFGALLPGNQVRLAMPFETSAVAGSYSGHFELRDGGGELLATAMTSFLVGASPAVLAGSLDVPESAQLGEAVAVDWQVAQLSGAPIAELTTRLGLVRAGDGAEVSAVELVTAPGSQGSVPLSTVDAEPGGHLVTLQALLPEGAVSLAVAPIDLTDGTPPVVTILRPAEDALVGVEGGLTVEASDLQSGIAVVEARLDGGDWRRLDEGALAGTFTGDLDALTLHLIDGAHVLDVRARDGAGLETQVTQAFIVDRTSPEIVIEGVEEAGVYLGPVAPVVSVVDEHPGSVTVTLDGIPMGSETVEASGAHTLAAFATDAASNSSVRVISFTVTSVDG